MNPIVLEIGIVIIITSLIMSIILFKHNKITMAFVGLIICFVWVFIFATDFRNTDTYRIADYNQKETGVVRIYDLNGDVIDEYNGNLIIDKQDNTITFVEVDGNKIITFNEDGKITVKEGD